MSNKPRTSRSLEEKEEPKPKNQEPKTGTGRRPSKIARTEPKRASAEYDEDEVLDLSFKKTRTLAKDQSSPLNLPPPQPILVDDNKTDLRVPWGSLQLYRAGKPVFCKLLRGDEPIEISSRATPSTHLPFARQPEETSVMSYSDWSHIIG